MFSQVSSRGGAGYVHGVSILGVGMPGVGISRVGLGMFRRWVPTPRHEISSRTHRPPPGDVKVAEFPKLALILGILLSLLI